MGICASNIRTTTLEPASPQDEGQPKKFTGASPSRASLKQPVEKQPIDKHPRTDEEKKALVGSSDNTLPRIGTREVSNTADPTNTQQVTNAAKPNDESPSAGKRRAVAASNQAPNGDFKISFSEQGDKYVSVQKWLSECVLNDRTPNPVLPIGGVFVHNIPSPEEMAKNSTTESTPSSSDESTGLKRHKSMMSSTKHYQIS